MELLKRLFLVAIIPVFVLGILFSFPQYSRSYDDKTTHPGLTDEMVDFYNFSSKVKLTGEEKEWIVLGSINEDTEPRWINHFYDPINNEGWKAENLGWVPPLALSVFSKTLLNVNTETVSSKNWVHNEALQVKYGNYWGNRTWENAIRQFVAGDKMFAYQTLGDVLHLLEDATVPDHTRNDTHVHEGTGFTTDGGSPYEDYAKDFTRATLHTADDLIKENKQPIILNSLDAYFDSLAKYSNGYFFSKDTINSKKYVNPKISREDDNYGYGRDEDGNEFPLTKISKNFNKKKFIFEITYTLKDDNNLVLPTYFSRLSREAVLNGAGVIKLFFDEVAKAEKDKSLIQKEPQTSWWQEMRSPLYGAIIPAYNSVAGLINRVMATGDSPNNNSASVLLATTQNPAVANEQEAFDNIQSLPQITQDPIITTPSSEQIIKSAPLPTPLSTPTTKDLVVGVLSGVSYGGGGASPQAQQETQQSTTTATSTATVANIDKIAPIITILGNNPATSTIGTTYVDRGATAFDDIDGAREVIATGTVNTLIAGVYAVTYTANDLSGNIATSTRVVNVIAPEPTDSFLYSDLNNNNIADSDEAEVIINTNRTLPAGAYRFNNLTIASSSVLTLEGNVASVDSFKGVKISAVNLTIDAGSSISADAKGYDSSGSGYGTPYANIYSAGASYGGVGFGNTASSTYGSATKPMNFGSGGGQCCSAWSAGGGAIQIFLTGILTNDGMVSSGGSTSSSGGGIFVKTNTLAGTGTFRANGGGSYLGNVQYGPGGGGRIALYSQSSSFSGKAEAKGGCASFDGNSMSCAENGTVGFFDTANNNLLVSTSWRFQKNDGPFNFNHITIAGGAVSVEDGATITANEILVDKGSSLALLGNSSLAIPTVTLDGGSTLTMSGSETLNINTLVVRGNSNITIAQGHILSLSVANLTIDSGSYISASEKGYGYGAGPGAPSSDWQNSTYSAGASYGGVGVGNTATSTYGSATEPTDFGSGGNGYNPHGGGAIHIIVTDNFIHNGSITANGSNTSSGGSIFVTTNKIEGNGSFSANGGTWYSPNDTFRPGGGGRIAFHYQSSTFTGTAIALGGGCSGCSPGKGGDGSVIMEQIGSSTTTSDTIAPIITSAMLSPNSGCVKIGDVITLTITADAAGYSLGTTTVNGVQVTGFTDAGAGTYRATYTISSGDSDRTSGTIPVSVILVDSAGDASVPFTTVDANILKLDANIPIFLSALVISTTTVDVLFSEDLNGSTITNKDFSITGHTLAVPDDTLAIKDAFEISAGLVRLTVNVPFAEGEMPEIIYNTTESNGVKDLAGNVALSGSVLASSGVW